MQTLHLDAQPSPAPRGQPIWLMAAALLGIVWNRHGVLAAIPSQLAVLAVVVLIAAALLWVARRARLRGLQR